MEDEVDYLSNFDKLAKQCERNLELIDRKRKAKHNMKALKKAHSNGTKKTESQVTPKLGEADKPNRSPTPNGNQRDTE